MTYFGNGYNQTTAPGWNITTPPTTVLPYSPPRNWPSPQQLPRVSGPESAKAYPLGPNSSIALFDADNPIFYVKTTDDAGFPTLRTFRFEEVIDSTTTQTQDDISELKAQVEELRKMIEGLM